MGVVPRLRFEYPLVAENHVRLVEALLTRADAARVAGAIVLDLGAVSEIDTTCVAELLRFKRRVGETVSVRILDAAPTVRTLFRLTGVAWCFDFRTTNATS
ncbi:MAG TPA: STAS domain-containing protein [Candidatus Acidoferrum sp.]|nr:STAS domain-containing protein [Candidatus Acidoferrum sp.]